MLVPLPFNGSVHDFKLRNDLKKGYEWIGSINDSKKIYLSLFQRWPSLSDCGLPPNYDIYIVSFHLEAVDLCWLKTQSKLINGEIIVLFDGCANNFTIPRVRFLSYYYWHIQLSTMIEWFGAGDILNKQITHKASAFCNRITSTKLITFTALAEYIGTDACMLVLRDWLEQDNIYSKNHIPPLLKELFDIFFEKYYGNDYTIDDFTNDLNYQKHTANPCTPAYQNCALHFTNESFDTSAFEHIALYSYPGPFITEKTLKCLLGATAFVPIGQFDTYGALSRLGFEFNYNFDTSFDNIIDNNDRLIAIVELIKTLSNASKEEIYKGTMESSEFNFNYIKGGRFYKDCAMLNQHTVEQIMEHIDLVTG
jgi:hypothetical protein